MKEKFMRFMQGRYGVDQLSKFTMGAALVCIVVAMFCGNTSGIGALLDTVGLAALFYTYFRMLSRNISKRYAENQWYLGKTSKIRMRFQKEMNLMKQRKEYHIYSCPGCKQKIRIPRGKGKIEIQCPKCRTKFVKKS